MKGRLAVVVAIVVVGGLVVAAYLVSRPTPEPAAPEAVGDGCLSCHGSAADDPGGVHSAERVPCQLCHGGDPAATNVLSAHKGLELEPGALDTVELSCGRCHERELERVRLSLMTTGRGIIAVDQWAFGERAEPWGEATFAEVLAKEAPSPAEDHVRRLCGGCHLQTRRANRDDAVVGIGSGCSACHVGSPRPDGAHPAIDGIVPSERCLGCHSRSGRISLSYQGLAESSGTFLASCAEPVTLYDGRSGCRQPADVHFSASMGCTDCHVHSELMGDGTSHARERQALEVRCETCHDASPSARESTWAEVTEPITLDLVRQRGQTRPAEERVRLGDHGTPLWNVRPSGAGWALHRKAGGAALPIPPTPVDLDHQRPGHERLSCASCHAALAPTCPTCHTSYKLDGSQWDFGAGAVAAGVWLEEHEGMGSAQPVLAVTPEGRIAPAIPGMLGTLDARVAGGPQLRWRLFSSFDPHTTTRAGLGCEACHRSAWAIGLGTGALDLTALPVVYAPAHPDPEDATRAVDGWVGPRQATPGASSTPSARSLDLAERDRVLRVGVCLGCHKAGDALWRDFASEVARWEAGEAATVGCVRAAAGE